MVRAGEPRIVVTQNDVRAIQLAKAALYAGVKLLMEKQGVTEVDQIRLAGAFGSFIDPKYAMVLGLIPDCDSGPGGRRRQRRRRGRADGAPEPRPPPRDRDQGARDREDRDRARAGLPTLFVDAMALPNKVDPFPKLASQVTLPARAGASEAGRRGRRGRG